MPYDFTLNTIIPAPPQAVYDAWLDNRAHSAMTGGKAKQSAKVGAKVTAWDGYIAGETLALTPGKRIVQSWRTSEFASNDEDSAITVMLAPAAGGTRLTLQHTNVPDGHKSYERGGWEQSYFKPMRAYFKSLARAASKGMVKAARKAKSARKAKAARKAPRKRAGASLPARGAKTRGRTMRKG